MWFTFLFGGTLIAVAILLSLLPSERAAAGDEDPLLRDYLKQRRRRRLFVNGLIGSIGAAIIGSLWLQAVWATAIYWSLLLGLVTWMLALAMADIASTRRYYGQMRRRQREEHAQLARDLLEHERQARER